MRFIIRICNFFIFALFIISCKNINNDSVEIEGFAFPEGAISDGKFIYISNFGKEFKPLDKDGDGFISKLSFEGKVLELNFLAGPGNNQLNAPKGMAIMNNVLYVTDVDRILGFDLADKKKIFELNFEAEKTSLLNDLTVKDKNTLFVSAMDIHKIFQVNISDTPSYDFVNVNPEIKMPNGLCWDPVNRKLYLGMFGRKNNANGSRGDIGYIYFENDRQPAYTELSNYQGNIDGVTLVGNKLLFTDWLAYGKDGKKGTLKVLDLDTKVIKDVIQDRVDGAGDFYFDEKKSMVWIPKLRENKLLIKKINLN
jgi:hypothetical protein